MNNLALPRAVRRTLRKTFGIDELRLGQQAVIARVLDGADTLAVMPSGAGKSLCYQLPALHLPGTTVVVSPLIALMKDQAEKLAAVGIDAEQLNSAQPKRAQQASMRRIDQARSDIVFATPERLADPAFVESLRHRPVSLFVVDEAHCISQWGHDFRPAYLEIGTALKGLGRPPVLALTATATTEIIDDIRRVLDRPAMELVNTGTYRPNLRLQVVRCGREEEKQARLREALANEAGCGIVYTATVKACTELHRRLRDAGESVALYHGRLPARERQENQDRFMSGQARVMLATNAFGMGIDKPDIRFVLHYQMPGSLQAYYQEAGRAGRDGRDARCALLFFRKDRQVQQFFLARRYPTADDLRQLLELLEAAAAPVPLQQLQQDLAALAGNRVATSLTVLRDAGLAATDRRRAWRRLPGAPASAATLAALAERYEQRAERDREALERMVFYAQTGFCRWRVLLDSFDEPLPFEGGRCGRCDNCLNPPAVSPPAPPRPQSVSAASPFKTGDNVRVPRYGEGQVESATADEVAVKFPDGRTRSFVASFVESL